MLGNCFISGVTFSAGVTKLVELIPNSCDSTSIEFEHNKCRGIKLGAYNSGLAVFGATWKDVNAK
jgi:hypothetical protein